MASKHGMTNLSELSRLAFSMTPISNTERKRRQNNRLRASAQRQSTARAKARTPSPPKNKGSPSKKKASPAKNKGRNASPSKVKIGARVRLPVVITHPSGRVEVLFRTTKKFYPPNAKKPHGYNLGKPMN